MFLSLFYRTQLNDTVPFRRCAIDFLEYEFSQRNPQVKAVTSLGSELDTIAFRSEDPSGRKVCMRSDTLLSCWAQPTSLPSCCSLASSTGNSRVWVKRTKKTGGEGLGSQDKKEVE